MSSMIVLNTRYNQGMLGREYERQDCSLARSLEVIGERWTLLIVRDAFYGVRRFTEFHEHLDIPKAVLSDRLKGLIEEGVLERRADPRHSGRHLYELTTAGRDLWPVVYALLVWGDRHRGPNSRLFRHAVCGSPLDERGSCPACGITPGPSDIESEPRPERRPRRKDAVSLALAVPHHLLEPITTQ
jgi:DNA-binding HxlR family transcriptional regulator